MNLNKWDLRFLECAQLISTWSKDPSTKVGAVCVDDRRIVSTGYNGFPRGVSDSKNALNHRETKYALTVHAEMNCIYNAVHHGLSLKENTLYIHGLPVCNECAKGVIQSGIRRVVCNVIRRDSFWDECYRKSVKLFSQANIESIYIYEGKIIDFK